MPVNQTTIQLLKILSSQNKGKKSKKLFSKIIYPKSIENRYKMKLKSYYKPLIDYVKKFLAENSEQILHGDSSEVRVDAIPGNTYAKMVKNMEAWVAAYFPEDPDENTKVYSGMKESAKELKEFEDREFEKQLEKSINVSIKEQSEWWPSMSENWANTNYKLIRSNASAFTDKINMIVERAVANGTTVRDLQAQIQKATTGLSDYKCRLLARDQIGKLQGQISQGQMGEIGLNMYIWSTSGDERVRDSHQEMEGLLCRWDDATVYSADGGKTWIPRPSGAVEMHPGQDIQCRCVALAYFPELLYEVSGEKVELPNVEIKDENYLINEGDAKDLEILDDYHKFFLPKSVRNNFSEIEKLNTYNDFKEYFENKFNIKLTTDLKSLSTEFANETINSVKETGQKIAVALNTYTDVFGKNSFKKLKRINLYDNELPNIASYNFNKIGEKDKLAGVIQIRDWNVTGRDIFHELAHAYQDSMALKNEDALLFSDRIVKENSIKFKSIYAVSGEAENAEMLAEAIAQGFTKNRPDGREIIMKLKSSITI